MIDKFKILLAFDLLIDKNTLLNLFYSHEQLNHAV